MPSSERWKVTYTSLEVPPVEHPVSASPKVRMPAAVQMAAVFAIASSFLLRAGRGFCAFCRCARSLVFVFDYTQKNGR